MNTPTPRNDALMRETAGASDAEHLIKLDALSRTLETDTQKTQIRIALAKWAGHEIYEWGVKYPGHDKPTGRGYKSIDEMLPNYPASLDACHEIIRHLYVGLPTLNDNLKSFRDELAKIKGVAWYQSAVLLSANAEEVSLALFRALNLGELGTDFSTKPTNL